MNRLNLNDLNNPQNIAGIAHLNDGVILASDNQGFQEMPGSWELWQILDDGRLIRVHMWLKKCTFCVYSSNDLLKEINNHE